MNEEDYQNLDDEAARQEAIAIAAARKAWNAAWFEIKNKEED